MIKSKKKNWFFFFKRGRFVIKMKKMHLR